jgi:hypothetical protein
VTRSYASLYGTKGPVDAIKPLEDPRYAGVAASNKAIGGRNDRIESALKRVTPVSLSGRTKWLERVPLGVRMASHVRAA